MALTGYDCHLQRPSARSEHCVRARIVDREEVSIPIGDSDTGSVHVECRTFVSFDISRLGNGRGSVVAIGRLLLIEGRLLRAAAGSHR